MGISELYVIILTYFVTFVKCYIALFKLYFIEGYLSVFVVLFCLISLSVSRPHFASQWGVCVNLSYCANLLPYLIHLYPYICSICPLYCI